jgi:glycosyltransferase involved in cell wall biosynthesis
VSTLPLRVCFHCLFAYPLFDARSTRLFGGAEVRASYFARELARRPGLQVHFMVADEGQPPCQVFDGVTVFVDPDNPYLSERFFENAYAGYLACCDPQPSFPYFRIQTWRAALLWQLPALAFHRLCYLPWRRRVHRRPRPVPASLPQAFEVYCLFHINETTADIIAACRREGGPKTVVFLIHDIDVDDDPSAGSERLSPRAFALKNADLIVAQTQVQVDRLRQRFQRDALVIRNPIELAVPVHHAETPRNVALWIGRSQRDASFHKRPDVLFELARLCPDVAFLAILNPDDPVHFKELMRERPDNVEVVEKVPFAEMDAVFARTRLFINTSGSEGFPNTFLQAGKHSVPIVSLAVDPGGMLSQHGAGIACGGDLALMARELKRLWSDPQALRDLGRHARIYVERFHDIRHSGDALEAALQALCQAPS